MKIFTVSHCRQIFYLYSLKAFVDIILFRCVLFSGLFKLSFEI